MISVSPTRQHFASTRKAGAKYESVQPQQGDLFRQTSATGKPINRTTGDGSLEPTFRKHTVWYLIRQNYQKNPFKQPDHLEILLSIVNDSNKKHSLLPTYLAGKLNDLGYTRREVRAIVSPLYEVQNTKYRADGSLRQASQSANGNGNKLKPILEAKIPATDIKDYVHQLLYKLVAAGIIPEIIGLSIIKRLEDNPADRPTLIISSALEPHLSPEALREIRRLVNTKDMEFWTADNNSRSDTPPAAPGSKVTQMRTPRTPKQSTQAKEAV